MEVLCCPMRQNQSLSSLVRHFVDWNPSFPVEIIYFLAGSVPLDLVLMTRLQKLLMSERRFMVTGLRRAGVSSATASITARRRCGSARVRKIFRI